MRKILCLTLLMLGLWCSDLQAQLNKEYFYYVGRGQLIGNRYREAIETLNMLIKADPKGYEAYFMRGIAKYNLDDLIGAEADFTSAIQYNPVYTLAFQYRAITRSRLGNYDDALKDFREAINLRPDRPGAYYSRGVTYLLSHQYEKAIADFDQFIKHESRVAEAYLNRGTSYLYLKDTTRAFEEYNLAIRTNRENPDGYNRRGSIYMMRGQTEQALADFDKAVSCDTTYVPSYFNRALAYSALNRPMQTLADFDRVIALDSTSSLAYFNRAIVRSQIGDYNRALEDYDMVARYSPNNVLVYYNRASLQSQLGNLEEAIADYSRAIELYPDFANAYLGRARLRYLTRDVEGSREDQATAASKIAEYQARLRDSTFSYSAYADTSRRFNQLLAFDVESGNRFERIASNENEIALLPLFKFTLTNEGMARATDPETRHYMQRTYDFIGQIDSLHLALTNGPSDIPADSLVARDRRLGQALDTRIATWQKLFERGVTQSLIRQYTGAIASYTAAIEANPSNPFLYINRSTTQCEMIDFISSIDNSYHRISVEKDPVNRLNNPATRTYNYDEAIGDLNKAAKLYPGFAYIYYNRANLQCLSGNLPEALDDYTRAIELDPGFAEAYFNRGLVQIYLKDTRKGFLDISKAGELGIPEAYTVLRRYGQYDR
ncbi:MAG: tetratricopeptide repeat protein [Rikenellaceae bacterium]|nr:tetratricopeptide repeat protein [Rikenellaceae bacterium]